MKPTNPISEIEPHIGRRVEEPNGSGVTDELPSEPEFSRRKALAVLGPAGLAIGGLRPGRHVGLPVHIGGVVNSRSNDNTQEDKQETEGVDSPRDFDVEVLAPHATFPDDVSAKFRTKYDEGDMGTIVSNLPRDASTVVFAKATWGPTGTSGWHTHPGPVIISITEGELELVNERDCITRTYTAGEAFIDPGQGNIHTATNPSKTESAVVYATFLGVPDGEPATEWVEPVECDC